MTIWHVLKNVTWSIFTSPCGNALKWCYYYNVCCAIWCRKLEYEGRNGEIRVDRGRTAARRWRTEASWGIDSFITHHTRQSTGSQIKKARSQADRLATTHLTKERVIVPKQASQTKHHLTNASLDLLVGRLFYFCIFQKKVLQKYIFGFRFYSSIPLPPGRGR